MSSYAFLIHLLDLDIHCLCGVCRTILGYNPRQGLTGGASTAWPYTASGCHVRTLSGKERKEGSKEGRAKSVLMPTETFLLVVHSSLQFENLHMW